MDDHKLLQDDINTLVHWSEIWQMRFEPSKCYTLVITQKNHASHQTYTMSHSNIDQITYHKYLGIYISENLTWSREIRAKANKVLGVLQRNLSCCTKDVKERAYRSLVRPLLEYSTTTWSPHTSKDIRTVESVQRRAARFVSNDYNRTSSVTEMLSSQNWDSLESRRHSNDLIFFYKNQNQLVNTNFQPDLSMYYRSECLHHPYNFRHLSASVDAAYKYSYFVRCISHWNAQLPREVDCVNSLNAFHTMMCSV